MLRQHIVLVFICFLFPLFSFGQSLKLLSASSQKRIGGPAGSSPSTTYVFILRTSRQVLQLKIDKVWLGNEFKMPKVVPISKRDKKVVDNGFAKGDTIRVYVALSGSSEIKDEDSLHKVSSEPRLQEPPPFKYEGAALVSYLENNKRRYLTIKNVETLPLRPLP